MHYEDAGGNKAMEDAGATRVARSHHIEYLKPLYAGEDVIALTWVENLRRVRSLWRYQFLRQSDNVLLAMIAFSFAICCKFGATLLTRPVTCLFSSKDE